jgi:hypothetical protein
MSDMERNETMLNLLSSWENLPLIISGIEANQDQMEQLMDIALYSIHPKSWRAAWVADKIHDKKPKWIIPYVEKMIIQLKKETSNSKKRQFLKLISLHEIPKKHFSFLIDYCMKAFTSQDEPAAVRVHSLQVLFNISEVVPDFRPELLTVIEHEIELHSTAGIISRGKLLAKKLHVNIKYHHSSS